MLGYKRTNKWYIYIRYTVYIKHSDMPVDIPSTLLLGFICFEDQHLGFTKKKKKPKPAICPTPFVLFHIKNTRC